MGIQRNELPLEAQGIDCPNPNLRKEDHAFIGNYRRV
jgi:hypothetical protein